MKEDVHMPIALGSSSVTILPQLYTLRAAKTVSEHVYDLIYDDLP